MTTGDPLARLDDAIASMTELLADLEAESAAQSEGDAEADERLAEANRRGERGAHWRVLQRRIDQGETSLEAIMGGTDTSPEAVAVNATARKNLAALSNTLQENAAKDPEALDPRASAAELTDELAARVRDIKRSMGMG
ncbi:MAG: hypothetical protein HGA51_07190 [Demequinaceae bacterium]|nr:hypothetical protein [Demequinaceae bacterium]